MKLIKSIHHLPDQQCPLIVKQLLQREHHFLQNNNPLHRYAIHSSLIVPRYQLY